MPGSEPPPRIRQVESKKKQMVYSMWSSTDIPAVRISAARLSILPISSSGLLPGAILKLSWHLERSALAAVNLRAVPRKENVQRLPRRGTPVQYTLVTLAFEGRRQEIPVDAWAHYRG